MNDDQLQEYLDSGNQEGPAFDKDYKDLFDALNETDHDLLSPGFAHRVTARLENKKSKDPIRKWTIVLAVVLGFSVLLAMLVIAQVSWYLPNAQGVNLYLMFGLAGLLLFAYHFVERKRKRDLFHDQ